jgi:DNA-binding MurR/RpiR family transcriptional regulator
MSKSDKNKNPSFQETLIQKYSLLSRKEKKVADYILQNSHTIFTLSIVNLARNVGVGPATVVRFAQRLGFSGFQQLKFQIMNEVVEEMIPEDRFKLLTPSPNHVATVLKIAEQEVNNINETFRKIKKENFLPFITHLRKGQCVYALGIGISSLLARLGAYLLNQAGLKSYFCGQDEHSFLERLINLTKKDVLLSFSFPPYSKKTIEAVKFCYERGITCLSVTDRPTAPIVPFSHKVLFAQTKNLMYTNSLSAVFMILNAIATEVALLNKTKAVANIDILAPLLKGDFLS